MFFPYFCKNEIIGMGVYLGTTVLEKTEGWIKKSIKRITQSHTSSCVWTGLISKKIMYSD